MDAQGFRYREELKAWWPDYDHNPVRCKQFVDDGLAAIDVAVSQIRGPLRTCVQAGGHAGFWPKRLAELFRDVWTFEPEPLLFQCLELNCRAENVHAFRCGLGAKPGTAPFLPHVSAGSWRVDPKGTTSIPITTVDGFALRDVDAIFLDIEGYEVQALEGAAETVRRWHPLILCELLPRSADAIRAWLAAHDYQEVARFGRDGIFNWRHR